MDEIEQQRPSEVYGQNYDNSVFLNQGIMQIRIDPDPILREFQNLLLGIEISFEYDEKTGMDKTVVAQVGKPLANKEGVRRIMCFLRYVINTQTVQGNFKEEEYAAYIAEAHGDFSELLFNNMDDFQITVRSATDLCNGFTKMIIPYVSRTIANKERDSYNATLRSVETLNNQKSRFNFFGRG